MSARSSLLYGDRDFGFRLLGGAAVTLFSWCRKRCGRDIEPGRISYITAAVAGYEKVMRLACVVAGIRLNGPQKRFYLRSHQSQV